jgi:plastocyanin
MKMAGALLALVLAAAALSACGGGGSSESTSTETSAGGEAAAGGSGGAEGGGSGGSGSIVQIETVSSSALEYAEKEVTAKAGKVSIEFTNPQSLAHDVAVESSSGELIGKTELVASGSANATIGNLEPGTYTFYCTVPGHREAGMEGTLTVE